MMLSNGHRLHPFLLQANTCWKRSTGYIPFYLMFGRDANAIHLFKLPYVDFKDDQLTNNDFSLHYFDSLERISSLEEDCLTSRDEAQNKILSEQLNQKGIYDKKVHKNRYLVNI